MKILTSLAEDKYFLGLAALINSVVDNGTYVDKIVVGYRNALPSWLPALKDSSHGKACTLPCGLTLELVKVDGDLHMVHEKPQWFQYLNNVLEPNAAEYFFFDSDIVVLKRMSFFGEWIKQGVAICEDVNHQMSADHPIRKQWAALARENGNTIIRELHSYFNSGFLGWTKQTESFITDWKKSFDILSQKSGDMKQFRVMDRTHVVLSANQDSFNLAAMITSVPISSIGPEAMGFTFGMQLMSHPIGPKPWNRKFFKESFNGHAPRYSDLMFWQNVNGSQLNPLPKGFVASKLRQCKVLRGVARFYKQR